MSSVSDKVKRPVNSFMVFRSEKWQELKEKHGAMLQGNISTMVSEIWNNADAKTRAKYKAKAEAIKKQHRIDNPDYKFKPVSKKKKTERKAQAALERSQKQKQRRDKPNPPSPRSTSSAASTPSASSRPTATSSVAVQMTISTPAVDSRPYSMGATSYLAAAHASQNQQPPYSPQIDIQAGHPAPRDLSGDQRGDQQHISTGYVAPEPAYNNSTQDASMNTPGSQTLDHHVPSFTFDHHDIDPAPLDPDVQFNFALGDFDAGIPPETSSDVPWDEYLSSIGLDALQGTHEAGPSSAGFGYERYPAATVESSRLPPGRIANQYDPWGFNHQRPAY